jgi:polyisoprenoid-binding protein YceI
MKTLFYLSLLIIVLHFNSSGQIYIADSCRITFFSSAAIENISATSYNSKPLLDTKSGDIQVSISNQDFKFRKKLMQEHFNEDYIESDKYPTDVFKGKINEQVDYTKDGTTKVTVTGTLDMHGVSKTITIPGTISARNGVYIISSNFNLEPADFHIKKPKILSEDIADTFAISLNATMKLYKSDK